MALVIHRCEDKDGFLGAVAEQVLGILQPNDLLASVALTGGRTAKLLYRSICDHSLDVPVRWRNVHFFWGDERCVPPGNELSNYRLGKEYLLDTLRIHPQNIHRIKGELSPSAAAEAASKDYGNFLAEAKQSALRLVLLSMGEDGHIASIFPGCEDLLTGKGSAYQPVESAPKPPPARVTLGMGALCAAQEVVILALGAEKKVVLDCSIETGSASSPVPPATPLAKLLRMREQEGKTTHLYREP